MQKRLLALFLTVAMLISASAICVSAAAETVAEALGAGAYNVSVCGQYVSGNQDDILAAFPHFDPDNPIKDGSDHSSSGDFADGTWATGKASYDPYSRTLTLKNAYIQFHENAAFGAIDCACKENETFTIEVIGDCVIDAWTYAITTQGNLRIDIREGSSLTVTGAIWAFNENNYWEVEDLYTEFSKTHVEFFHGLQNSIFNSFCKIAEGNSDEEKEAAAREAMGETDTDEKWFMEGVRAEFATEEMYEDVYGNITVNGGTLNISGYTTELYGEYFPLFTEFCAFDPAVGVLMGYDITVNDSVVNVQCQPDSGFYKFRNSFALNANGELCVNNGSVFASCGGDFSARVRNGVVSDERLYVFGYDDYGADYSEKFSSSAPVEQTNAFLDCDPVPFADLGGDLSDFNNDPGRLYEGCFVHVNGGPANSIWIQSENACSSFEPVNSLGNGGRFVLEFGGNAPRLTTSASISSAASNLLSNLFGLGLLKNIFVSDEASKEEREPAIIPIPRVSLTFIKVMTPQGERWLIQDNDGSAYGTGYYLGYDFSSGSMVQWFGDNLSKTRFDPKTTSFLWEFVNGTLSITNTIPPVGNEQNTVRKPLGNNLLGAVLKLLRAPVTAPATGSLYLTYDERGLTVTTTPTRITFLKEVTNEGHDFVVERQPDDTIPAPATEYDMHVAQCKNCGMNRKEYCSYDPKTGRCVCGNADPELAKVDTADVRVATQKTTLPGTKLFFVSVTIKVDHDPRFPVFVEYMLPGTDNWVPYVLPFTLGANQNLTELPIRITDANKNQYYFMWKEGYGVYPYDPYDPARR